ncbi:PIG-L family deacetylase [Glycomyces tenuis]|uniref:PIG-L family deacetylase n=2 Tax=Glycomyces tenuis TaxID=58116 RepID=UPI0004275421|nr:PIG-L family deacetylase [Glycomyces tenuis]
MSSPAPRPSVLRRRSLLFGGIAGLAVAAAAGETGWSLWGSSLNGAHPLPEHPRTGPVHMQIVAHPDDCLYFINPRIARVLAAGAGICTVVLTAGEADGRNTRDIARAPDYAGYAAARNTGLRRAYAHLATGDSESEWDREAADLDSGQQVEICVLRDRPEVHLIFCSLWTNLGRLTGDFTRLLSLWEGGLGDSLVLPPEGSPLTGESTVDRETIQATLLELLEHYRPAVVNTLDPDPDPVVGEKLGAEQTGYSDHIDHTAAALFAWEAVREWGQAAVVESWRGYYNRRWPGNLGSADRDTKGRALNVYAWADGFDCGDPAGCGDRLVIGPNVGDTYGIATHPRYSVAVAATTAESALRPLTVQGSRLRVKRGQSWDDAGGPELLPSIGVAGSRVFAVSPEYTPAREDHTRDVHCLDLDSGEWTNLGNPAGSGDLARHIGPPTAADDGAATVVAVRSPDRGVHVRTKPDGGEWGDWTHLDGRMVHDSPAAIATADGIAILAATPEGLAIWERHGDDWTTRDLDLPHVGGEAGYVPAGAVAAAAAPDGRIVIASRSAGSADVVLHYGLGAEWTPTLLRLDGGILPPAVAVSAGGTVAVAADDATGAPAVVTLALGELEHGLAEPLDVHWSHGDVVLTRRPAIAFDGEGGLRLWATAVDGEVYTASSAPGVPPGTTWAPALRQGD